MFYRSHFFLGPCERHQARGNVFHNDEGNLDTTPSLVGRLLALVAFGYHIRKYPDGRSSRSSIHYRKLLKKYINAAQCEKKEKREKKSPHYGMS